MLISVLLSKNSYEIKIQGKYLHQDILNLVRQKLKGELGINTEQKVIKCFEIRNEQFIIVYWCGDSTYENIFFFFLRSCVT